MKNSIAKKITIPFFLVFVILNLILATIGYYHISNFAFQQAKNSLRANAMEIASFILRKVLRDA